MTEQTSNAHSPATPGALAGAPVAWEKDLIRDYMMTLHKEQVRDRRWRQALTLLRTVGFVFVAATVTLASLRASQLPWGSDKDGNTHTAYVQIKGEILEGRAASADHVIPALQKAFAADNAKAVVLRINSPGGSPVQAGRIHDEILALRAKHPSKPVYAVVDDIGASGGYYIAVAAQSIYADRASLVGSIGVISSSFGFTGLMDKLGVERRAITAGEHKALLDPFSPLSPEIKTFWESVLQRTNQQFVTRVQEGRGERLKPEPRVFSGLLWNGEQAMELGLIDGLGSLQSVARDVIGESDTVDYTTRPDIFGRITERARIQIESLLEFSGSPQLY
ncbi:MAG: S49 family peptidase [Acidovorax sp.]|nr:S49 family peptidase [Acidovorax sp.]